MVETLRGLYGLEVISCERASAGAGSDTFFAMCEDGRYVVKFPADSHINNPELEPELCDFLLSRDISVCRFVRNLKGNYISEDGHGRLFHVQKFIDGTMFGWNTASEHLLEDSARTLGRIHTALKDYKGLPVGIGRDFFRYMTPETALRSYENTLRLAREKGHSDIERDVLFRMELASRFPEYSFDLDRLTCSPTHGDYFISQLLCRGDTITAVIDWTTACVHPVVWEIMRSYVYAAPECASGTIDEEKCLRYFNIYEKHAALSPYDREAAAQLFYYQLAACDYYGQYYASDAVNRDIYLRQAIFSTELMKWFDSNIDRLTDRLGSAGK